MQINATKQSLHGPKAKRKIEMLLTAIMLRPLYFGRAATKYDIFYRMDK
jgi:hypothetical protein